MVMHAINLTLGEGASYLQLHSATCRPLPFRLEFEMDRPHPARAEIPEFFLVENLQADWLCSTLEASSS
jgi:hypothetical protein